MLKCCSEALRRATSLPGLLKQSSQRGAFGSLLASAQFSDVAGPGSDPSPTSSSKSHAADTWSSESPPRRGDWLQSINGAQVNAPSKFNKNIYDSFPTGPPICDEPEIGPFYQKWGEMMEEGKYGEIWDMLETTYPDPIPSLEECLAEVSPLSAPHLWYPTPRHES